MEALPDELKRVAPDVLEDYVLQRLRQFAPCLAAELTPGASQQQLAGAFSRALARDPLGDVLAAASQQQGGASGQAQPPAQQTHVPLQLRFGHSCRYIGCREPACSLCRNNPHKTCNESENFDEAYAEKQVLRSKCEAELAVSAIGGPAPERIKYVLLSLINDESYSPSPASGTHRAVVTELLKDAMNRPLLACSAASGGTLLPSGHVLLTLHDGTAKLPDVSVVEKTENLKQQAAGAGKSAVGGFRMMAVAVERGPDGAFTRIEGVAPAVSEKFVVKTQRAYNDYRKVEFPHHLAKITDLKHIGDVTAARLKECARQHLGPQCPLESVETVEQLKEVVAYSTMNKDFEATLVKLLNMKGQHRHKFESLKATLTNKVVYDDTQSRVFFPPPSSPGAAAVGLLYHAKQGVVQFDAPAAIVERPPAAPGAQAPQGRAALRLLALSEAPHGGAAAELVARARAAWRAPRHQGWQLLADTDLEFVSNLDAGRSPAHSVPLSLQASVLMAAQHHAPGQLGGGSITSPTAPHLLMPNGSGPGAAFGGAAAAAEPAPSPRAMSVSGPYGGTEMSGGVDFEFTSHLNTSLRIGSGTGSGGAPLASTVTTGQDYDAMISPPGARRPASTSGMTRPADPTAGFGMQHLQAPSALRSASMPPQMQPGHLHTLSQMQAQHRTASAASAMAAVAGGGVAAAGAAAQQLQQHTAWGGGGAAPGVEMDAWATAAVSGAAGAAGPGLASQESIGAALWERNVHLPGLQAAPHNGLMQLAAQREQAQLQQQHELMQQQHQQYQDVLSKFGMAAPRATDQQQQPLAPPAAALAPSFSGQTVTTESADGSEAVDGGGGGGGSGAQTFKRGRSIGQNRAILEAARAAAVADAAGGEGEGEGGQADVHPARGLPTVFYHMESRGRHAPRFRVDFDHDQATAPTHHSFDAHGVTLEDDSGGLGPGADSLCMGGLSWLEQGDPSLDLGNAEGLGAGAAAGAAGLERGHREQITAAARHELEGAVDAAMRELEGSMRGGAGEQAAAAPGPAPALDASRARTLRRGESDSFKRFLTKDFLSDSFNEGDSPEQAA